MFTAVILGDKTMQSKLLAYILKRYQDAFGFITYHSAESLLQFQDEKKVVELVSALK